MHEKYISRIANILSINLQRVKRTGIVEGSLGIAMFLYEYSRISGYDSYSRMADEIVEYSIEKYLPKADRPFSYGIYGFAWAIHTFEERGFIELEENAFSDIHKLTSLKYSKYDVENDMRAPFPLFSLGLYSAKRGDDSIKERAVDALEVVRSELKAEECDACYILSIIYFLRECLNHNFKIDDCRSLLDYYLDVVKIVVKNRKFSRNDVFIMKKILPLNNITDDIRFLEVDSLENIYCNWQTVLYSDLVEIDRNIPVGVLDAFMKRIACDIPDEHIGLNGLSSLGINLIRTM